MATLPTDDEKVELALDVFRAHKARPGHVIPQRNFVQWCLTKNLHSEDLVQGLEIAAERMLVDQTDNGGIRLTDAGFAAL